MWAKRVSLVSLNMMMSMNNNKNLLSTTAFVVRFITRRYIVDYDKGSDSRYKHEMIVDTDTVLFEILDSSSPITLNIKRFDFASHVTDLFLVMYSITDRQSYLYVRNLLKHLVLLKGNF